MDLLGTRGERGTFVINETLRDSFCFSAVITNPAWTNLLTLTGATGEDR